MILSTRAAFPLSSNLWKFLILPLENKNYIQSTIRWLRLAYIELPLEWKRPLKVREYSLHHIYLPVY